jgi:hypothetical protein
MTSKSRSIRSDASAKPKRSIGVRRGINSFDAICIAI